MIWLTVLPTEQTENFLMRYKSRVGLDFGTVKCQKYKRKKIIRKEK